MVCMTLVFSCSSSDEQGEAESGNVGETSTREVIIPENDECSSGDCENGKGLYRWKSGDTFSGQFVEGKRNGTGTYTWASGSTYTGEWKDGMRHGKGVYVYANEDKYSGMFENDKRHGQGIYTYKNGETIPTQNWKNGQPVR